MDEHDPDTEPPVINTELIRNYISARKFPLIFGSLGLFLLLTAVILVVKSGQQTGEVIFDSGRLASSSATVQIRIDVQGAVFHPGVYAFADGDRIQDALRSAGGFTAGADRAWIAKNLNLAAKLVDGGKIYIPSQKETGEGKISNASSFGKGSVGVQLPNTNSQTLGVTTGKININTASEAELDTLPGVGPVTAAKIISNRPYQTIEELKTKKSVGAALFEKLKDLLTVY